MASLGDRYTEFLVPTRVRQWVLNISACLDVTCTGLCSVYVNCSPGCAWLQFRQALRRPQPAERDYLEAQATGVGLLVGEHARCPAPRRSPSLKKLHDVSWASGAADPGC